MVVAPRFLRSRSMWSSRWARATRFAAGFLAGTLQGLPMKQRLRLGHLSAAAVLAVPEDHAAPLGSRSARRC